MHKRRAIRLSRHQIALLTIKSKFHYITSLSSIFVFLLRISAFQWNPLLAYIHKFNIEKVFSYFN